MCSHGSSALAVLLVLTVVVPAAILLPLHCFLPCGCVQCNVRYCCCSSVHPFVRCMYCDKTQWCTADILIPHKMPITLVFWHQQWLVGDAPLPVKYSSKVTFEKCRHRNVNKHVLFRANVTYNNCRKLHNEIFRRRHSTQHWPQPHGLSAVSELLVKFNYIHNCNSDVTIIEMAIYSRIEQIWELDF